ncbi:MAG: helix-turn-helix domain-containing protein [Solirubrobacterales bacterium]|nr:helix-turn-helix domain-containing protein [Solirubrobacterales bacterium]
MTPAFPSGIRTSVRVMERAWLKRELDAGRSIESIAREVGKDPSTVSYWVNKHALISSHAEKHAARGGIEREELERLVGQGFTVRAIAEELQVSFSSVQHWLRRYDLATVRARRSRSMQASLEDPTAPAVTTGECPRHGTTTFGRRPEGSWRCLRCRSAHVAARRRRIKQILVAEAGGVCVLCGYDRTVGALHFHHVDPSAKEFHLSFAGATRSIASSRAEAAKCVLLCANCHAEVENGAANIPNAAPRETSGVAIPG